MPGNVGITGNERTGSLASIATMQVVKQWTELTSSMLLGILTGLKIQELHHMLPFTGNKYSPFYWKHILSLLLETHINPNASISDHAVLSILDLQKFAYCLHNSSFVTSRL